MQVDFYQLGAQPVERVLPMLAEKTLAAGGRMLVVAESDAVLSRLDECLWSHAPTSFLPHARAGGEDDAEQPILLAAAPDAANAARNIALADGHWRDEALTFDRVFHLFDTNTLEAAREAWKALKDKPGVDCRFHKQEGGKWTQLA